MNLNTSSNVINSLTKFVMKSLIGGSNRYRQQHTAMESKQHYHESKTKPEALINSVVYINFRGKFLQMKGRNSVSSNRALPTIGGISITGPTSSRSVRFHSMRPRHSLPRCTSHCATIGMWSQISTCDRYQSHSSVFSFDTLFSPVRSDGFRAPSPQTTFASLRRSDKS